MKAVNVIGKLMTSMSTVEDIEITFLNPPPIIFKLLRSYKKRSVTKLFKESCNLEISLRLEGNSSTTMNILQSTKGSILSRSTVTHGLSH